MYSLLNLRSTGEKGKSDSYVYSDAELAQLLKIGKEGGIQRYKGLGEMNATQLGNDHDRKPGQ